MSYPQFFRVRQSFERPRVEDIPGTVEAELSRLQLADRIRPGQTVAITAGSRGIINIRVILRAAINHFKRLGARPFIVPSMGSHGGGTPAGQVEVLASYGVTEEYCGCPIKASMETVVICQTTEGFPVHFDRHAYEADHVLVCGRVKPHTDFTGDIQSGLMKMMLIGLGKHEGAKVYHRAIHDYSFPQIVRSVAGRVLKECKIVAGLAVIENGYDETAQITAVRPEEIEEREKELLLVATRLMPRLPFREVDILVIDEIGKNISGTGMDTNVVGRKFNDHAAIENEWPKVRRIVVRSLTEQTHGNAAGIGMVEFCRTQALAQMDRQKTWVNALTAGHISSVMIPLHYDSDREILDNALPTIGLREPTDARVLWIKNTLELAEVECSAAYLQEARSRSDLEIIAPVRPLGFDAAGNWPRFSQEVGG
ncbi:MAG: lactate racemase domain-containing protein [Pirellulales bacterium]